MTNLNLTHAVLMEEERYLLEALHNADDTDGPGFMPGDIQSSFHRIRAALDTTPKAEDVRRETIEEAIGALATKRVQMCGRWGLEGTDAMMIAIEVVRALADRSAPR